MIKFLDYITKDEVGQKRWSIFFGLVGTIIAFLMAILFWNNDIMLYKNIGPSVSVPIGFLCVYYLGIQKNRGNVFGILANINEIIVNTLFGNFGFVIGAIYNGVSHVIGYQDWKNNTNEKGQTKVRDINDKKGLGLLLLFLILGTLFVIMNYVFDWIGDINIYSPIFWGNILIMYLGIVAQGAMVMRYRYAWWLWLITNVFAVPIQIISGNYVFGVMYLFYEINCILALYAQYTSDNVEE